MLKSSISIVLIFVILLSIVLSIFDPSLGAYICTYIWLYFWCTYLLITRKLPSLFLITFFTTEVDVVWYLYDTPVFIRELFVWRIISQTLTWVCVCFDYLNVSFLQAEKFWMQFSYPFSTLYLLTGALHPLPLRDMIAMRFCAKFL